MPEPVPWVVAADTGGTFTDAIAVSPEGTVSRTKVLSDSSFRARLRPGRSIGPTLMVEGLPDLPPGFFRGCRVSLEGVDLGLVTDSGADGVLGLEKRCTVRGTASALEIVSPEEAPILAARVLTRTVHGQPLPPVRFRLGTTKATNALLEERFAPVALFTTIGFGDLLFIGDQRRSDLFGLFHRRPAPLYRSVCEVDERTNAEGRVEQIPDLIEVARTARRALAQGCRVAAVAFLHSWANPENERIVTLLLRDLGFESVTASHRVAPFIKFLPRAGTAVVDAALGPLMRAYLDGVSRGLPGGRLRVMTSAGILRPASRFRACDSLLSGPAGGVVGSARASRAAGFGRSIAFDMGGTSTDVSRFDGGFDYRDTCAVGDGRIYATSLRIESVAAGGGSVCGFNGKVLTVGPQSAGARPGPACYGAGGPLTLTDVNLLLGRLDPGRFGVPVYREAAEARLEDLLREFPHLAATPEERSSLLLGWLAVADERMADAIRQISVREGYDPSAYALVAFGGAGGVHACAVARRLGIGTVLIPEEAGLLSARGLLAAEEDALIERQCLATLEAGLPDPLAPILEEVREEATRELAGLGIPADRVHLKRCQLQARLQGQDSTLEFDWEPGRCPQALFRQRFASVFGYLPEERAVELVRLRVVAGDILPAPAPESFTRSSLHPPDPGPTRPPGESPAMAGPHAMVDRAALREGDSHRGPLVVADGFSSTWVPDGWELVVGSRRSLRLEARKTVPVSSAQKPLGRVSPVQRELLTRRLMSIVEEAGLQLQRTALSTNIKERCDYSCALLDAEGRLVASAPHIPVHLGALGLCVREVARRIALHPGDVILTNDPGCGGSHLPDVTVISPLHAPNGDLVAYCANRAHHAELGGIQPGSMPSGASSLAEEGVVIPPFLLCRGGVFDYARLEETLRAGPWPSRAVEENLADVRAQVAANRSAQAAFMSLLQAIGQPALEEHFGWMRGWAREALLAKLPSLPESGSGAAESLDDGARLVVRLKRTEHGLLVSFEGSSPVRADSLNATPAIVTSALVYVLRLWVGGDFPLNDGFLEPVTVHLPRCLLNPDLSRGPSRCPPVVGGNVEVSQRLVDTLLKALGLAACSQGTMNNVVFGDASFSYYETVCGGGGAGPAQDGSDCIHTHMTNTAITDVEVLEYRYPVRLLRFARRLRSGGVGCFRGGDGVVREYMFTRPLSLSLLTQHRASGPYGVEGGGEGRPGRQTLVRPSGARQVLPPMATLEVEPGDVLILETPGGGAWGAVPDRPSTA